MSLINRVKRKKKIIDSSSFFLNLNLKYFLTLKISQADIISKLEAYKEGPIRTIIRVSFAYTFLKLNFEMGMYTEVSFFSNSVILPAILFNPLDGPKSLNKSSGFYYGFGTTFDMNEAQLKTNLKPYKSDSFFFFFSRGKNTIQISTCHKSPRFFYGNASNSQLEDEKQRKHPLCLRRKWRPQKDKHAGSTKVTSSRKISS